MISIIEVIRIVKLLKVKIVVIENVIGFKSKKINGQTAFEDAKNRLIEAGYTVADEVLSADKYQVPQVRKRVIIIACRTGIISFPKAINEQLTIENLLEDDDTVDPFYWMSEEKVAYYLERQKKRPGYVRFVNPSEPAKTLRAGYYKSRGAEALLLKNNKMRMFTELELARIQTFPDSYIFIGCHRSKCEQICNAVPPRLAFHIAKSL